MAALLELSKKQRLFKRSRHQIAAMFTKTQQTSLHWKMPSGQMLAKEYTSRSRWLKQLNNTVNGGADSHEDY